MSDYLGQAFPRLASSLPKLHLADLPTPLEERTLQAERGRERIIRIKCDDVSAALYGGNKVRKLEYLLRRARDRGAMRVATFGGVGSNHALATTLYAAANGLRCVCFLSHQRKTPQAGPTLERHRQYGTELVYFGGSRRDRIAILRQHLSRRDTWVIPLGGSCWLGAVGFVNAGLELAAQLEAGRLEPPDRLYVANGTMATAAGLALGLAAARLETEVHAVRVTEEMFVNPPGMRRLLDKTATLMRSLDNTVPVDLAARARLVIRNEFFGTGYAHSSSDVDSAVREARRLFGLTLETTYTGKAMAALLHDAGNAALAAQSLLFWNTYNSRPLPAACARPASTAALPAAFARYLD